MALCSTWGIFCLIPLPAALPSAIPYRAMLCEARHLLLFILFLKKGRIPLC